MDVRLARDGRALLVQDRVRGTGHDAQLVLELVPALDAAGRAVILPEHAAHRHGHGGNGAYLLVRAVLLEVLRDPGKLLLHIGGPVALVLCKCCLHAAGELGQGHRHALDAETLEELAFVAHRGIELIGTRSDLEDPGRAEGFHDIADGNEVAQPPFEDRIVHPAVRHVREGHLEAAQYLAGRKEPALGVAQAGAVSLGALIERSPQKDGLAKVLGKAGADELGAEVAVGKEQAIDSCILELLQDLETVVLIVEQAFLIDIVDIDELHAELTQLVGDDLAVLPCIGRTEDASAGRCIAKNDLVHEAPLLCPRIRHSADWKGRFLFLG